jgi:hypothetical protein
LGSIRKAWRAYLDALTYDLGMKPGISRVFDVGRAFGSGPDCYVIRDEDAMALDFTVVGDDLREAMSGMPAPDGQGREGEAGA